MSACNVAIADWTPTSVDALCSLLLSESQLGKHSPGPPSKDVGESASWAKR